MQREWNGLPTDPRRELLQLVNRPVSRRLTVLSTGSLYGPEMATESSALHVATWNLSAGWTPSAQETRAALINRSGVELLCAQEVPANRFELLLAALGEDWWGAHSLSVRPGLPYLQNAWGVAVFGRARRVQPDLAAADVIGDTDDESGDGLFWRRTLHVPVTVDNGWPLHVVSVHVRPGSVVDEQKLQFLRQLNEWLKHARRPVLLGVDSNYAGPDDDGEDAGEWALQQQVWGAGAAHGLRDLWHEHPTEPDFTHRLAKSDAPRRIDHLYVSSDLAVVGLRHLYDEAIAAGSDHALVIGEIRRQTVSAQRDP